MKKNEEIKYLYTKCKDLTKTLMIFLNEPY